MPKYNQFKNRSEVKRFNKYIDTIVKLGKKANQNLGLSEKEWTRLEVSARSLQAISYNIPRNIH